MSAVIVWPLIGAAFAAGVTGSVHCFAMCGAMAGALGMRARSTTATALQASLHALLQQFGRVSGYTLAGVLAGTLGQGTQWFMQLVNAAVVLRFAAGVLTLLIAVRIFTGRNLLAPLERWGAQVWRHLQPLAQRTLRSPAWHRSLLLGLLWGWLPCGMVYSVLLMSVTTGNAAAGAATMASFGLGTLPAMLASSLLTTQVPGAHSGLLRAVSGVLLAMFGTWLLVQPLLHSTHVH
jgi:sulfite exporter TauE/SafE